MSKLEELIQQYCPDGVEFVKLGEILGVNRGRRLTKAELSGDGQYYVYHGSKDTPLGKYTQFNVKGNTTIVVNTGGIGGVKFCADDFWCSDGSFWIGHSELLNDKYVYYFLSPLESYFASQKRVGGVPTIDRSVVENVEIPVPPLPVQEEIVRILDSFTELQAELQAELQKRLQQYNYYRDNLLSFEGRADVEWKRLGDVCDIRRGIRVVKKQLNDNGTYPVFQNSIPPMGYYDQYNREGNMPYIICAGSSSGSVGYCSSPFWAADDCFTIESIQVYSRYAFHCLKKNNHRLFSQVRNGSMPRLPHDAIDNLIIPIPSFEEQERIAAILDRFDALTTDITAGLPAEIEARRKQYEYYRDQLLTFKQKA